MAHGETHDSQCEADIEGPMVWTPCGCAHRTAEGDDVAATVRAINLAGQITREAL